MNDTLLWVGLAVGGYLLIIKPRQDAAERAAILQAQAQAYRNPNISGQRYINGVPSTMGGQVNQIITGFGSAVGGVLSLFKGV